MFKFAIRNIGVYRFEQYLKGQLPIHAVSLSISGIRKRIQYGEDLTEAGPGFSISIKGEPYEVDFDSHRENWVVILEDIRMRLSGDRKRALVGRRGEEVRIPVFVPVEEERIPGWRNELQRMQEALQRPTPTNLLRAELGVAGIFRFMLDHVSGTPGRSPAQQLRGLIEEDTGFKRPLAELSRACGFTPDHLRVLFEQAYHMTPNTYRNQRRMALAMEWLTNTRLSVKEIAARLGFEHTSAFSSMFRRLSGNTPSEVVRKYRHG